MDWVTRLRTAFQGGNAHSDPKARVDDVLEQLSKQIAAAEAALLNQSATASELRGRAQEASELAARRQTQASAALQAGDDELARKALAEQARLRTQADSALQLAEQAEEQSRALRDHVATLRLEQLQLQAKRDQLMARGDVAELDRTLADVQGGMDARARSFDELAEQTQRLETEAAAHREVAALSRLAETGASGTPAATQPETATGAAGATTDVDLDRELEALRAQLNKGKSGSGRPPEKD